ncbi:uncharacterized protein MONOS_5259 [Monocercomonoides exilis]|uniref:uncharacterized protein n=1 Tax=Monocercomonoides exilis TaxID=2049356 RepID=UPI003559B383|nr:hypothetical protein MONOS_5259 [Monocercomonoides exilis]|eukprot:MONOS_5259.1-p1 / transcript=MONOS_5259.1 / gene=MONOS_5259 / organism=Monocercomonoides_exilis_PA203 / gene_product=unspecified product / transcript_product=unspecified product / location=Mono_scaffold00151:49027-55203(-) / protein_length=2034 / sequence_SO=supercontig / SO=protein_coding / is_pseudo=false
MYFVCESFVASVKEPLFAFMGNITQKDNSIAGHDRTEAFGDWDVDLFIFFDGFFDDTIYVDGTSGVERAYCGLEKAPCYNVNYGIGHLKRTQNTKQEIIVISNTLMAGFVDVGGICMKAKTETIVEIECQREASGSDECILKSESLTEIQFIGIVVPSSFSRTISAVIESSTQNGELHMKNCKTSVIGGKQNTIGFILIKSTGKMVELNSVTISDVKSTVSLFSFSLSSANVNEHEYKVKLFNCTLKELEIDGGEEAAVIGGNVEVGMMINGSRFDGALSEKSEEGGALKIALSAEGYITIQESSFTECICENMSEGGKGGGIYLDCSSNEEGFQLSSISFSGCSATIGKNMFVKSGNLVNSVNTERFAFDCSGYSNDGNAFVGEDEIYGELDLRVFLVSLKWMVVSVSTGGHDTLGCGSEKFPCESMKSGIDHIDRSGTEGERKVKVRDEGTIEDIFSFTDALVIDGCANEGDETEHRPIHFEGTIKGDSATTIISSTASLSLLSLKLQIRSQFVPSMNSLISSSGVLQLVNCLFEIQSSTDIVQYSLISTTTGSCTLKGCSLADYSFVISPFVMASSVLFENSNFSNIANTGSGEGGVARVTLKNDEKLEIKSTNASSCSLSSRNGKGGFLYLDCQNCLDEKPFLFDVGVTFENNNAATGKNVFILGKDFNASVTNESFAFDYSSMINDDNLFVGSDNNQEKDLFMFLIPFSSFEIFISSEGFDVARCGSEEEPCFTMWKGMKNVKEGNEKKTIQISGSTIIQDSFNMSNYQIKKSVKMGEEDTKAMLNFEKAIGSQLEYIMVNDVHLELANIKLQLSSGFGNSAKTIISNKDGDLVISECSFYSEAGVNNGFDCVFVDAIEGSVEVNDLSIESCNVGNSIFGIHDAGVSCHLMNVRVELLNESGGCILSIKKSEQGLKINEGVNEDGATIEIGNSSFSGVKRIGNGASILESKCENKICLVVKESNITEDKSEKSEKGGAIYFTLGSSGSMKMIDSTITNCNCSISEGKGGGVYLATDERGELNFSFVGMKFSANTAKVGNDIFIECFNITSQIDETQFQFDLREGKYNRSNAIFGRDECDNKDDTDLIGFVTIHQSDTIIVSSVNGTNERQCGTNILPCYSINHGLVHLTSEYVSLLYVDAESVIEEEINLEEMSLSSKSRGLCEVEVKTGIEKTRETLITTTGTVSLLRVNFVFDSIFISSHESLILPEGGILEIMNCSFTSKQSAEEGNEYASIPFRIFNMEKGELQLDGCTISNLILHESALFLSSPLSSVIDSLTICHSTISKSLVDINECGQLKIDRLLAENITVDGNEESLIYCLSMKKTIQLANCTMGEVSSKTTKGKLMKVENCTDVIMDSCIFDGSSKERNEKSLNAEEEMCRWDGSLVDAVKSSVMMKDTTIANSPDGGITMSGGEMVVKEGRFENNDPSIEGYPSLRRNIICSDSGTSKAVRIVSERDSSLFIPVLESVEAKEETDRMKLTFKGMLLVPCNLSFSVVKRKGEEKEIEHYDFDSNGFLSERKVEGSVAKDLINGCGNEIEMSVHILFGNAESPSSTNSFILKNATESDGDGNIVKGDNSSSSLWIIITLTIILFVVLIVVVVLAIRWRKVKERNEELQEIVNDNIRKDPKAFEMVTMEMSPEEQWRRAEREAEKKNEERTKKREYEKSLKHSESSEHLLSESGSTEYIFGKDSDKNGEWDLEKEEETRKRTSSPSISSADTETAFVRGEDLFPTTSSMSNLVDAMACSSPYEKLIVDLRDSLFMLLHGRNEKKDLAIGTLKEREMTGVQMLFWVANGALHSLEDEEDELPSLRELSPHIVLFSEHMVICIALHSDCSSSSDDSDSSSISSTTIVTSASEEDDDDDERDSLPSSAFEDDEDKWKECLRWKAPELVMNRKMGATEKSVAFSIGMMLWECVTLEIPFGEYEGEVAGQKIADGEKPDERGIEESGLKNMVNACLSAEPSKRPTLTEVKKELVGLFPSGTFVVTMTDAIILEESSEEQDEGRESKECEKEGEMEVNEMKGMFNKG